MRIVTAFLATVLLAAPLSAVAQQAPHTIYVSAQGEVRAHPDMATGNVGGGVYSSSPVTAGDGAPILPGTITLTAVAYITFALK